MIEHERSYVFTHEGADDFIASQNISLGLLGMDKQDRVITDYYLDKYTRIRVVSISDFALPNVSRKTDYLITRKTGDKSRGFRFEEELPIDENVAKILIQNAVLTIKKIRRNLSGYDGYQVTMDFVERPMKLAILEIEAVGEATYPVPNDITLRLFDKELRECPLCGFKLFNRHIGVCGAPSSGKTETAKWLSHVLNTQFDANSFNVTEFATTFIQKYRKAPSFWEQFFIWHGQHEREENAGAANVIISDCPTFLAYIYLLYLPKEQFSPDTALVMSKVYKRSLFDIEKYSDLIFLELLEYSNNGIRYQTPEESQSIENRIKTFLNDHNVTYKTYNYKRSEDILNDLFHINS